MFRVFLATVTLALCLALISNVEAQQADRKTVEFRFDGATKVEFKQAGDVKLHLHIFKPDGWDEQDRRSAIVFFFGGGWVGGTPGQFEPQCKHLANRGMVAITAEYRVKSRHGAHPADCVADAKDAVRWIRTHARELGVDSARIAVSGGSAGGHVAASTATIETLPEETDDTVACSPNALVLYNPVCDTSLQGYGGKWLGNRMYELSPVHNLRKQMPPTLVFHGKADKTVPFENALRFKRVMDELGNACELVAYAEAGHGFFNRGRKNSEYEDTTRRLDAFLTKLGFLAPPTAEYKVAGRSMQEWLSELSSSDKTKQRRAAESLGQFGPLASGAFADLLEHRDAAIRYIGASHIGDHQTPKSAIGKLRSLLEDSSRGVKVSAAYALCRLGEPEAGLPVFESIVSVKERGLQCSAADFLGRMGRVAELLLDVLEKQTAQKDYHVKNGYTFAIKKINQDDSFIEYKRPTGGGQTSRLEAKLQGWAGSAK